MIIFYARCSTAEQNEARQLGDAHACHAEKIYIDKASGKNSLFGYIQNCTQHARSTYHYRRAAKERCCFPKSEGVNRHLYPARSIYADRIRSISAA